MRVLHQGEVAVDLLLVHLFLEEEDFVHVGQELPCFVAQVQELVLVHHVDLHLTSDRHHVLNDLVGVEILAGIEHFLDELSLIVGLLDRVNLHQEVVAPAFLFS